MLLTIVQSGLLIVVDKNGITKFERANCFVTSNPNRTIQTKVIVGEIGDIMNVSVINDYIYAKWPFDSAKYLRELPSHSSEHL